MLDCGHGICRMDNKTLKDIYERIFHLMNTHKLIKVTSLLIFSLVVGATALLARSAGRGPCPQCGWTACLACWQKYSQHNTCPSCKRYDP
jgi:hypothetical protein